MSKFFTNSAAAKNVIEAQRSKILIFGIFFLNGKPYCKNRSKKFVDHATNYILCFPTLSFSSRQTLRSTIIKEVPSDSIMLNKK